MFIERPGAQLYTLAFGRGPLTLLAVGGWIGSGEIWHPLFGHLPHWRCISVDHRGTGATLCEGPITLDAMADDLLAVADALATGPCVLAAESAGAAVALHAVQKAPQRFVGMVLVGAAWRRSAAGASDAFAAALRRDYPAELRKFIDRCLPETDSVALRRWALQMLMRSSVDDAVALLRSREQVSDFGPAIERAPPSLLLHGDRDYVASLEGAQALAQRLPRAELHVLPGAGHVPIVTDPTRPAALIEAFGSRISLST